MRIAYQGEPGAYSEAAALRYADDVTTLPCRSFDAVFAAVRDGAASHGILPMENSIGGSIHRNFDLLIEHDLPIVGEVELDVDHCLLAMPGVTLDDVRTVYSHPQALAQCERFLNGLGVEMSAVYDTAGGAKLIAEGQHRTAAALASRRAAEVFGLAILKEGVQDYAFNVTRFCVISRTPVAPDQAEKTTVVFALPSRPGSLFKALSVFAMRDINLTKLESRPIAGRPWEYMFYVDLTIARQAPECTRALMHLAEMARWVRTLGSYPAWKPATEPAAAGPLV
jgi:arogenate/prephenate dehydratase